MIQKIVVVVLSVSVRGNMEYTASRMVFVLQLILSVGRVMLRCKFNVLVDTLCMIMC